MSSESRDCDVLIIGAGVSGLASAYQLLKAKSDLSVWVLERRGAAEDQTKNNSGVFHSPLNYQPGSVKSKNCSEGRLALQQFCAERGVPIEITGKLIIATEERELAALKKKHEQALGNGIADARLIARSEVLEREPHAQGAIEALLIPGTGIIDFSRVAAELTACIREQSAQVHFHTQVSDLQRQGGGWLVKTSKGDFRTRLIINCAGVEADRLTSLSGEECRGRIVPVMGVYYRITGESKKLVKHIIYPLPHPTIPVLGVHVHRTIGGDVFAGPNAVINFDRNGRSYPTFNARDMWEMLSYGGFYRFLLKNVKTGIEETIRSLSKRRFAAEVQKLIPALNLDDLEPATAGIRAQLVLPNGEAADDFVFTEGEGVICCQSVVSPGATACMANGRLLAEMSLRQLAG